MYKLLYKGRFILFGSFALTVIFFSAGCKKLKAVAGDQSALESLFEDNILNRNFIIHLAIDNGNDVTSEFTGYNFVLTKDTSFYNGRITGTKGSDTYLGTWESNEDYSKLTINFTGPSIPAVFTFINRSWKFTKKSFPIMELAPWFSSDKILHMERL